MPVVHLKRQDFDEFLEVSREGTAHILHQFIETLPPHVIVSLVVGSCSYSRYSSTIQRFLHQLVAGPDARDILIRSMPFIYGRRASGRRTDPSGCWKFSKIALTVRPTATPEPFSV